MKKAEVNDFLTACRVFYVATVDESGSARVRPFGAHLYKDGELWFMTWKAGNLVYGQMRSHPQVEICGYAGRQWIRLSGEVEFVEDRELAKQFIAAAPMGAQKQLEDPVYLERAAAMVTPFRLKNASVSLCTFMKAPEVSALE